MKLINILMLVLTLLALAIVPSAAAPSAGSCVPGAVYDPACDVNHDGTVNILDIQLAAGHWNQSGPWVSDNNHTHLGQTWTGSNNSLVVTGSFDAPNYAPLVLSNYATYGDGLRVPFAYDDGVSVDQALSSGVSVGTSQGSGLVVNSAYLSGLAVYSAGFEGVYVQSAGHEGINVGSAPIGVYVSSASGTGAHANTMQASGQWGFYTPDRIFGTVGMFSALSLVAQVSGPDSLTPGDLVAAVGWANPLPGSTAPLPLVRLADDTFTGVIGVIESHLALTSRPSQPAKAGEDQAEHEASELRNADGPAQAGDYVAITVLGAAQVKVDSATVIQAGQRLTVSSQPGHARALRTVQVEGITLNEGGPTLGVALEAAKDGLVWVMVNP